MGVSCVRGGQPRVHGVGETTWRKGTTLKLKLRRILLKLILIIEWDAIDRINVALNGHMADRCQHSNKI